MILLPQDHQGRWETANHPYDPIPKKPRCSHAWKPPAWVGPKDLCTPSPGHIEPPQAFPPCHPTACHPPPLVVPTAPSLTCVRASGMAPRSPPPQMPLGRGPTPPLPAPAGLRDFSPKKKEQTKGTHRLHRSGAAVRERREAGRSSGREKGFAGGGRAGGGDSGAAGGLRARC